MKAYMTNAELVQNEIEKQEKQENGSNNGKKAKPSKKIQKSKGKAPADQSDSSELASSNDNDLSKAISCGKEVDFYEDEEEEEEETDDESSEFNAIYFLMKTPNRIKMR